MSITVEDGTGKADADSYGAVTDADTYLASTGYAADWATFLPAKKENNLKAATRLIDASFTFRGTILVETQALSFPRDDLLDREGRVVNGVPNLIRIATYELAYHLTQENFLEDASLMNMTSIKVGPIDLQLSSNAQVTKIIPDSVIRFLTEFGRYRYGKLRQRALFAG